MRFSLRLCVFALILFLFSTTHAQSPSAPIILWVAGDLYAANPDNPSAPPEQLTSDGTLSAPTIAYNAAYPIGVIAVKQLAPVARAALDRVQAEGFIAEYDLPADIALYDIAARTLTPIATQPADASLFVDGVADKAIVRSAPSWSPDRTRLAWAEFDFGAEIARLMEWDGAQIRLVTEGMIVIGGRAPEIRAGGAVFAGRVPTSAAEAQSIFVIDADGSGRGSVDVALEADEEWVDFMWMDDSHLGLLFTTGRWLVIDALTGTPVEPAALPNLTINVPNSLTLDFGVDPDLGMYWEARDPSNPAAASGAFPGKPGDVALSPDGRRIAFTGYPSFGGAAIWEDGNVTPIAGTGIDGLIVGAVLWGDMQWSIPTGA